MAVAGLLAFAPGLWGCVTVAEFRKLEHEVAVLQGARGPGGKDTQQVADLSLELEELRQTVAELRGRIDVAQHQAEEALNEARSARKAASGGTAALDPGGEEPGTGSEAGNPLEGVTRGSAPAAEVEAYREAYASWRGGDTRGCIDRFQQFLQTYPSSGYADDAAFWMADCYFREGDYRAAILRFDDVASGYPTGEQGRGCAVSTGRGLDATRPRVREGGAPRLRARDRGVPRLAARARGASAARGARQGLGPDDAGEQEEGEVIR